MRSISEQALAASEELARQRGAFPNWSQSRYAEQSRRLRNATCTSIAPTGTISILAGTSAGIEPLFGLVYRHQHVLGEQTLLETNPLFERHAASHGLDSSEITRYVAEHGSLAGAPDVSPQVRELFQTALEIAPAAHLRIQAAFQKHVDNAVSKTINLPRECDRQQVAEIYLKAWQANVKGITIYRYGSMSGQPLVLGVDEQVSSYEHFARCDPDACKA